MARPCPACGRPNRDTASKCLYCVTPLGPVGRTAPTAAEAGPPEDSSLEPPSERHLLILVPGGETESRSEKPWGWGWGPAPADATVAAFARIAEVSIYDARLALATRRPRLFRRLPSESDARRVSGELREARVPHYVVAEASVLALPVVRAFSGHLRERHIEWRVEAGAGVAPSMTMPLDELLLLVSGEITRERHNEKRIASTKGVSRRLTSGLRLHLYARDSSLALEIDPESFDFAMLGPEQTTSAHLNCQKLVSRLVEWVPAMEIDRGFDAEPVVVARSGSSDVTDALAQGEKGPKGVLYDNEAAFRFYARWRYRVSRHLSRATYARSE